MKITFIEHSGFAVELEKVMLIFDYYKGELPKLPQDKKIFVFASHNHGDHYNPVIWELAMEHPRVSYILSDDIKTEHLAVFMGPYEEKQMDGLRIQTLKSNDLGVAFLVEAEGKTIYHAGDLNWWHWNGEPEEDNRFYKETFLKEMERLRGKNIDVAFVLLDPRQEDKYCLGMNYFLETVNAGVVFPMHCFGSYHITKHYLQCEDGKKWNKVVQQVEHAGQVFYEED